MKQPPDAPDQPRLISLDQFRGCTVAAMLAVNFLGGFACIHPLLKHHNTWCSYADTIMPQFFFAAGWALRLVWLRDSALSGSGPARRRTVRRSLSLLLLGLILYHLDGNYRHWDQLASAGWREVLGRAFWRDPFQALVHIAVTTLWILPVLSCTPRTRFIFAAGSGLLHLALSAWFWYPLLHEKRVIDGGPLGFLTWTLPMLAGAWTCDVLRAHGWRDALRPLLTAGAALMAAGYALSCGTNGGGWAAPPFFAPWSAPDLFTMSQRAGSLSYLTFASGFSLAVAGVFVYFCDGSGRRSGVFGTLGRNALAAYIIHLLVMEAVRPFAPEDSPLWWAVTTGTLYFIITCLMVRWLNERRLFLRL